MTREQKLMALAAALQDVVQVMVADALAEMDESIAAPEPEAHAPEQEVDIKALQKDAKMLASKVLRELGKDILGNLLSAEGAKTFTDLKTVDALDSFMASAQTALDCADEPEADEPEDQDERTRDDIKGLLLKINNAPTLGREVTKQILSDFGVLRLGELKAADYAKAYKAAEEALNNA